MPRIWDEWKELAEQNGVDQQLFESRIWNSHWSDYEAATIPKNQHRNPSVWVDWSEIALANGVGKKTFISRIWNYGLTPEEAATKPLRRKKRERIGK